MGNGWLRVFVCLIKIDNKTVWVVYCRDFVNGRRKVLPGSAGYRREKQRARRKGVGLTTRFYFVALSQKFIQFGPNEGGVM